MENFRQNDQELNTMHKTPAGERRKSLIRDSKELAKDAKLLEKVAQSYGPHWWRSIHQEEME